MRHGTFKIPSADVVAEVQDVMLTSKQRAYLLALAHDRKPVILLGHKGLTDAVLTEIKAALLAHELIKARLSDGGTDDDAQALANGAGAEVVDRLGRVVVLYGRHPDQPKIVLPPEKKKGERRPLDRRRAGA